MKSAILFAFAALAALAQHPEPIAAGRQLFLKNCSACHGDTAKGGRAHDLTSVDWKHGSSLDALVKNIVNGIPGTQMPAFPLPDPDARALAAFLLSLNADPAGRLAGDPANGRALFYGTGSCAVCHMFAGRGSIFGPDLTGIRARFKPAALLARMAQPIHSVELRPGLQGTVRNEDTFTLQVLDANQKWHMIDKRSLPKPLAKKETPHPNLPANDRNDIAAFLLNTTPSYDETAAWRPAADFNVSFHRILNAAAEPQNWLTYWGDLRGTHFSGLKQITPANAPNLKSVWTYQLGGNTVETTPLVADVRHRPPQQRRCSRRQNRPPPLAVHPPPPPGRQPLHRYDQPRLRPAR
jgi:mono/diheme cytochrome c family protein